MHVQTQSVTRLFTSCWIVSMALCPVAESLPQLVAQPSGENALSVTGSALLNAERIVRRSDTACTGAAAMSMRLLPMVVPFEKGSQGPPAEDWNSTV